MGFFLQWLLQALPKWGVQDGVCRLQIGERSIPGYVALDRRPLRSAGIEQTLELGARGPRRLLVVLIDDRL
jgi:hypothetical protein